MKNLHLIVLDVVVVFSLSVDGFLFDKRGLLLVPSVAFRNRQSPSNWILYNQGWYYEENRLESLIMEKSLELLIQHDLDRQRIRMFTAEGKKYQDVCIDGLQSEMCTRTDDKGRIRNLFAVTNEEIEQFREDEYQGATSRVVFRVSVPRRNLYAQSEVFLCDNDGLTIISDIDDTIKITEVTSKIQTLINTFSGEFRAVEGMAKIYRTWQRRYNATFAYLTASPDQLYPFLREFLDREQFPQGSAHMRHFTWLDANFIAFFMSADYMKKKSETLQMFFDNTLNRRFILLGDIFQKDPDIYADAYRQYPQRIHKIFIRKYRDDDEGQQRLENIFNEIPREKWTTFETGDDLPADLFS